jgi:MoxR-like ATPase
VHSIKGASLLVGGPGTAKTTVINQFMSKFNSEVSGTQQKRDTILFTQQCSSHRPIPTDAAGLQNC